MDDDVDDDNDDNDDDGQNPAWTNLSCYTGSCKDKIFQAGPSADDAG